MFFNYIILRVFFFFFQIFLRCGKHQFDSVDLVNFAGSRIVVNGHDVCLREGMSQFFDNTLSNHMVWKAGKRLGTNDVWRSAVDQLDHLTCQEPSFTCLVSDGYERFCVGCQVFDVCGGSKRLLLASSFLKV